MEDFQCPSGFGDILVVRPCSQAAVVDIVYIPASSVCRSELPLVETPLLEQDNPV